MEYKLQQDFRKAISKIKDKGIANRAEFDVGYSTGFLALDYLNGTMVHVKTDKLDLQYPSIGLVDGAANTFIGRSGCGKSTLCVQIIGNIVRQFKQSTGYIDDIEGSLPMIRKEFLLHMTPEELEEKMEFRNTGITTENVYQRIRVLHDLKLENRDYFEYDTGLYDTAGNRIFKLVPSVYMIDSLPMLMPDDIMEEDELNGGMGATATAKKNTQLVKKMAQIAKEANIILITVNHILDDVQINPMQKKQAQVSGLKQGERLPGGKAAIYLANNMFRVDDKSTLKSTEGFGIDGSICYVTIIKSRTNRNMRQVPLIFNKSEGRLGGAGAYMYLSSAPEIKFQQKMFKQKLYESPELQQAFAKECNEVLTSFLATCQNQEMSDEGNNIFDMNAMIMNYKAAV